MRSFLAEYLHDRTGTVAPVFLMSLPWGLLATFLPLYGRALGASGVEVGALFTAFALVGVIGRPLAGIGTDRFGRKPFIIAGAALYLVATVLFAASATLPVLYIARFTQGVASALFWVALYSLLADHGRGDTRGRIFGRMLEAFNAGTIIGTLAGYAAIVVVGIVLGWRVSFWLFMAANAAALVLFIRKLKPTRPMTTEAASRPASPRTLSMLLVISFVIAASYALTTPIIMLYLQDRFHASYFWIGVAYAPAAIAFSVLPSRLGGMGDHWGRKRIMAIAILASGLASLLFPLSPSLFVLAIVWLALAVVSSAASPAQNAVVSELTGGNIRGGAYGFYAAAAGLGESVGPLIGGWLYDNAGHNSPFWATAVVLPLAALLVAWKLPEIRNTNS